MTRSASSFVDGRGEHQRGGERVAAVQRVVDDVDAGVATHAQRLAQRLARSLGTHREIGDLAFARLLDHLQRLLDGVLVELAQAAVDGGTVGGVVGGEGPVARGVRDVLDQYDDLHGRDPTSQE